MKTLCDYCEKNFYRVCDPENRAHCRDLKIYNRGREEEREEHQTNEERTLELFLNQFPEYKPFKASLTMNIFCDIIDKRLVKNRIIAVSDLPHNLDKIGYKLPKSWKLKEAKTN